MQWKPSWVWIHTHKERVFGSFGTLSSLHRVGFEGTNRIETERRHMGRRKAWLLRIIGNTDNWEFYYLTAIGTLWRGPRHVVWSWYSQEVKAQESTDEYCRHSDIVRRRTLHPRQESPLQNIAFHLWWVDRKEIKAAVSDSILPEEIVRARWWRA